MDTGRPPVVSECGGTYRRTSRCEPSSRFWSELCLALRRCCLHELWALRSHSFWAIVSTLTSEVCPDVRKGIRLLVSRSSCQRDLEDFPPSLCCCSNRTARTLTRPQNPLPRDIVLTCWGLCVCLFCFAFETREVGSKVLSPFLV